MEHSLAGVADMIGIANPTAAVELPTFNQYSGVNVIPKFTPPPAAVFPWFYA